MSEGWVEGVKWAADVVHAEARWQLEKHARGAVGAQIVEQRMTVIEKVLRDAADRHAPTTPEACTGSGAEHEERR